MRYEVLLVSSDQVKADLDWLQIYVHINKYRTADPSCDKRVYGSAKKATEISRSYAAQPSFQQIFVTLEGTRSAHRMVCCAAEILSRNKAPLNAGADVSVLRVLSLAVLCHILFSSTANWRVSARHYYIWLRAQKDGISPARNMVTE